MKQNIILIIILMLLCILFFFIFINKIASIILTAIIIITIAIYQTLNNKKDFVNQKLLLNINKLNSRINLLLRSFSSYVINNNDIIQTFDNRHELHLNLDGLINLNKKFIESSRDINEIKSIKNLDEYINELMMKFNSLIETINIFNEKEILQINEKLKKLIDEKYNFNNLIIQFKYYSEILTDFINSIINNIESTSNPLSEQVLIIKQNIKDFLVNISNWKEELTNENKGKSFKVVISKYDWQNEKFNQVFDKINKCHKNFKKRLDSIISTIDKISVNSDQIRDIYEKIRVLSLNASIESARADKYGKGFKVVSNEIKKLSDETQNFVGIIMNLINEAKIISTDTIKDFGNESDDLTKIINVQIDEFKIFYDSLKNYYDNFNSIFLFVTKLTDNIDLHINKFNPIFQLHDISIQELSNINSIISKFHLDNADEINDLISNTDKDVTDKIFFDLISFIEKKVTTNIEIDTINKITKKYGIKEEIKIDDKIDFF